MLGLRLLRRAYSRVRESCPSSALVKPKLRKNELEVKLVNLEHAYSLYNTGLVQ